MVLRLSVPAGTDFASLPSTSRPRWPNIVGAPPDADVSKASPTSRVAAAPSRGDASGSTSPSSSISVDDELRSRRAAAAADRTAPASRGGVAAPGPLSRSLCRSRSTASRLQPSFDASIQHPDTPREEPFTPCAGQHRAHVHVRADRLRARPHRQLPDLRRLDVLRRALKYQPASTSRTS